MEGERDGHDQSGRLDRALARYTEALRHEVWPLGVAVSLVEPGAFATGVVEAASRSERAITDYDGLREPASRTLHRALRRGADGGERWTVLGFSLPESRRDDRHLLRSRLRWAGFGPLRSGLWIAPGVVDVATVVADRRLLDHVLVFHATPADPTDISQMVRDASDLPALAARYHQFLQRWDAPAPLPDAPDDLARRTWLVSEWLLLLRDDPQIPLRLLPEGWPAVVAEQVFQRRHAELQPSARRIADELIDAIDLHRGCRVDPH